MDRKNRFAIRLKELRRRHELTQEQFAARIDRSVDAVSNMERGVSLPSLDTLDRIAEQFRMPLREILDWFDDPCTDPERLRLETALRELAGRLATSHLAIAVALLEVLVRHLSVPVPVFTSTTKNRGQDQDQDRN